MPLLLPCCASAPFLAAGLATAVAAVRETSKSSSPCSRVQIWWGQQCLCQCPATVSAPHSRMAAEPPTSSSESLYRRVAMRFTMPCAGRIRRHGFSTYSVAAASHTARPLLPARCTTQDPRCSCVTLTMGTACRQAKRQAGMTAPKGACTCGMQAASHILLRYPHSTHPAGKQAGRQGHEGAAWR